MKKYKVPAVERAFQIIDMLAMSSIGLTKTDIASKLEIPYSTAFNLLNTMEGRGYARKDEASGKYYLGFKFLSLANAQKSSLSLREIAAAGFGKAGGGDRHHGPPGDLGARRGDLH